MYYLQTEKQRKYFKETIRLHYERGYGEDRISRILPIGHATVSRWIAIFEREKGNVFGMQSDGKSQPHPAPAESDVKALQSRIKELEKRLRMAEIKAEAYDEMINVAEAKFKIPIRKKLAPNGREPAREGRRTLRRALPLRAVWQEQAGILQA